MWRVKRNAMMKSKGSSSKKLIKCSYISSTYIIILHKYYIHKYVSKSYTISHNETMMNMCMLCLPVNTQWWIYIVFELFSISWACFLSWAEAPDSNYDCFYTDLGVFLMNFLSEYRSYYFAWTHIISFYRFHTQVYLILFSTVPKVI